MRRLRAWAPALLWAALIFLLSSRSSVPGPRIPGFDKVAHLGAYTVLGTALAHGVRASALHPAWGVAAGLLYGLSDEAHQAYVPGREPDPADWVADALGVLLGTFLYHRWLAWRGLSPSRGPRPLRS